MGFVVSRGVCRVLIGALGSGAVPDSHRIRSPTPSLHSRRTTPSNSHNSLNPLHSTHSLHSPARSLPHPLPHSTHSTHSTQVCNALSLIGALHTAADSPYSDATAQLLADLAKSDDPTVAGQAAKMTAIKS